MRTRGLTCALLVGVLFLLLAHTQVLCSSSSTDTAATWLSDSVTPLAVVGELSMLAGGQVGKLEAAQTAKAMAATAFATELLKFTVREKRPSGSSLDSFPSGHTSEAFAMATMWSQYHPKYALAAYGLAAAIGWSRIEQDKHNIMDVAAGAALGTLIAKHFANQHIYAGPGGLGVQYKF